MGKSTISMENHHVFFMGKSTINRLGQVARCQVHFEDLRHDGCLRPIHHVQGS